MFRLVSDYVSNLEPPCLKSVRNIKLNDRRKKL